MKSFINASLLLLMLFAAQSIKAEDCIGVCSNADLQILDRQTSANIEALNQVSEQNKVRVDLAEAKITYSFLGVGAGTAKIFLTVSDGKLVDLNIDARVGMLGFNEDIKQKITIDQLMRGRPLEFSMDGAAQPALRVRPKPGFNEKGGIAILEIWDGERYKKEEVSISDSLGGQYKIYHGSVARTNEVTGLRINMDGTSIPRMRVRHYAIETR